MTVIDLSPVNQNLSLLLLGGAILAVAVRSRQSTSVKNVQGPENPSLLLGHEDVLRSQLEVDVMETPWFEQYGEVFRTRGIFGIHLLHVSDPKALQYIMHTSGYHFYKAHDVRAITTRMFGPGLLSATGPAHQRQRKVMNPAFSNQQLKTFLSVFQSVTRQLTKKWDGMVKTDSTIDVYAGLESTALDIIGKTGFDYEFNALSGESSVLGNEMRMLFADSAFPGPRKQLYDALWRYLPTPVLNLLEMIPSKEKARFNRYQALSKKITKELMEQKKKEGVDQDAKDILSVLARSNDSESEKTRISESEVLSQAATFIFAGHDTTATTLTWLFYELSKHPEQQARLRAEIAEAQSRLQEGEDLTSQDYDAMPFLNACLKEVLRFYPIVPILLREAERDDVIPLSEPITGANGQIMTSLPVPKGQRIMIRIARYNRLKSVWGNDADQWNPARFLETDKKEVSLGVFSNLMTFSAGLQACIGWRFALIELQSVTAEVISNFEFSIPEKGCDVVPLNMGLQKPAIRTELHKGPQLPLKMTRILA